jgi:uncharacterized membrane protein
MYPFFLALHSLIRTLLLVGMLTVLILSVQGWLQGRAYQRFDRILLAITNGITHTQLLIGFALYFGISPVTTYFMKNGSEGMDQTFFFGVYHIAMMTLAAVVLTLGGSFAKRASDSTKKFKTIALTYGISLGMILAAIPWFRPHFRMFE